MTTGKRPGRKPGVKKQQEETPTQTTTISATIDSKELVGNSEESSQEEVNLSGYIEQPNFLEVGSGVGNEESYSLSDELNSNNQQYEAKAIFDDYIPAEIETDDVNILFTVNGMNVRKGHRYKIIAKPDEDAPDGYKELGISKAPIPNVGDVVEPPFDNRLNVFDTGFYESSLCYRGMKPVEVKTEVQRRIKNIKNRYEEIKGEGVLDQDNFDHFRSKGLAIYEGRIFTTDDIEQLYQLYFIMLSGYVCPEDQRGNPQFSNTMYCIQDVEKVEDRDVQRTFERASAISAFTGMLRNDYGRLIYILNYVGLDVTFKVDDKKLLHSFSKWLDADYQNVTTFTHTYNKTNNSAHYEEMKIYYSIMKLLSQGKITKTAYGHVSNSMYGQYDLDNDLKVAAKKVITDDNYKKFRDFCLAISGVTRE